MYDGNFRMSAVKRTFNSVLAASENLLFVALYDLYYYTSINKSASPF